MLPRLARPLLSLSVAGTAALAGGVLPAASQVATTEVEENFRMEPNGTIVAEIRPETVLLVEERRGSWVDAWLEGWVWARSLQAVERGGYDLVVSADGGENLRAEPQGVVLARLRPGTLLEELERRPGWIRVRRRAWIWAPSVTITESRAPVADADGGEASASRSSGRGGGAGGGADVGSVPQAVEILSVPRPGLPILSAPDGDTLARARGGTDVQVLGREGSWARVRVDGWVWDPPGGPEGEAPAEAEPAPEATPGSVRGDPDRYRGRLVTWTLQFISLERAERVRTDFYEGEPFLLMRPVGDEGGFVYVAVPPDRVSEAEALTPLDRLEVAGRIRTGSSALTGSPVLDLVELRRTP